MIDAEADGVITEYAVTNTKTYLHFIHTQILISAKILFSFRGTTELFFTTKVKASQVRST